MNLRRELNTKINVLRCTKLWLWIESRLGREIGRPWTLSKVERDND